jgi:hypothetical protein
MAAAEPITMGGDLGLLHCAPECPYLEHQPSQLAQGTCGRDGKALDFYDWYLAHCKGQTDEYDEAQRKLGGQGG